MNIVFFSDTFLPQINGVVTYLIETGRELRRTGHRVLFVVPKTSPTVVPDGFSRHDFYYSSSIAADRFYPSLRVASTYSLGLDRTLAKFSPDVMHIHAPLTIGFGGIIAARRFNKPLVGTYHTFIASEELFKVLGVTRGRGTGILKKITWEYTKLFYNPCDLVIAPTEGVALILRRNGIKSQIEVLHEGIRLSQFRLLGKAERLSLRRKYKLAGKKIIVFVGRLSKEKNLILLLQAAAEVFVKVPQAHLLLIGDGPQKDFLQKMAKRLEIEERVTFTGFIPRERMLSEGLYGLGDVFATASKFETFGLTVLEAIGAGLPVVTVESQGASELVEGNGFVSSDDKDDLADNLVKILTNEELSERFRENSLKVREKYAVEKTTESLIKIYEKASAAAAAKKPHPLQSSLNDLSKLLGF